MMISRPELTGTFGAVSATHWLAASAGMAILERGGNACDAAVAAGFVLQVVEPQSNGLGGDLSAVVYMRQPDKARVICGQGPMPRSVTIERFRDLGLTQIPGSGVLPATVPGAFGGWLRLLAEFGTMRLADVLDAGIGYAEHGYPLLPEAARAIGVLAPLFETAWPGSGAVYLSSGIPAAGDIVRNKALAATMRRLLRAAESASSDRVAQIEAAHKAFYDGFVAEAIGDFVRDTDVLDATGRRHRGMLTSDDMSSWRAGVEAPASLDYHGYTVHKPGLWSQGPVFLQQLALLDGFDLAAAGLGTGEYTHFVLETAKLALADREAWYGDPGYGSASLEQLLSPEYSSSRRALIDCQALAWPPPGKPDGREPLRVPEALPAPPSGPDWMTQLHHGIPNLVLAATVRSGDTCALAATDRWGNLVAAVPSGGWLKSSPVIPGLGFPLGTRGQAMWLAEGHPNALGPGKRPRTTLSPTVAVREGGLSLAFGTPGGDRQDQWTVESFLAVTEFGLDLQAATETVMFHTDHFPASFSPRSCRPGVVEIEANASEEAVADLRGRGHDVALAPAYSLGKICMVGTDTGTGLVRAAAGPRGRQAYAVAR